MSFEVTVLLVLGIGALGGLLTGWVFDRLRIPAVVGTIAIGFLVGAGGLGLVGPEQLARLGPMNEFCLGLIGLLVGSELKAENFRDHGRQFLAILLAEGMLAALLVCLGITALVGLVTGSVVLGLAVGLVLGAIASATDPASTSSVLWDCRSEGPLTTGLLTIIALDDGLAMALYALATNAAAALTGGEMTLLSGLLHVGFELGGALLLGGGAGLAFRWVFARVRAPEQVLAAGVGALLLLIGVSRGFGLDVIMATMALGATLTNLYPRSCEAFLKMVRGASIPVYVIFFFLVGARLDLRGMPGWMWAAVAVYFSLRMLGKVAGAWIGARLSHADISLRRYGGMGILAQGGVAIGLAITVGHSLQGPRAAGWDLAASVVTIITATTLLAQLVGPALTRLAVSRAGEVGRKRTAEDIIEDFQVVDVMVGGLETVAAGECLAVALGRFADGGHSFFPVIDGRGELTGTLCFDDLRTALLDPECWPWLLVDDVMQPALHTATSEQPLRQARDDMLEKAIDRATVVRSEHDREPVGLLDMQGIQRFLDRKLISLRVESARDAIEAAA